MKNLTHHVVVEKVNAYVRLVRMGGAGWGGVSCSLFLMLCILLVFITKLVAIHTKK